MEHHYLACRLKSDISIVRFGIGRFTTEAEVDFAIKKCVDNTLKLREMRYVVSFYLQRHRF